jgi:hypothetical protein
MSMLAGLRNWIAEKIGKRHAIVRTPVRNFKPCLEALEDRLTPATIRVAVVADNSGNSTGFVALANQLNHDTLFHFSATVVAPSQVATVSQLNAYDVVVTGGSGNSPNGGYGTYATALSTWVLAGHAVVMTGWGTYANENSSATTLSTLNNILPILLDTNYQFVATSPFTVTPNATVHPVTAGITPFVDNSNHIEIPDAGLPAGATVLATTSGGSNPPVVVVRQPGLGRSVYLGELFTADVSSYSTSGLRTGQADKLLEQAIAWADNFHPKPVNHARHRWGR